MMSAAVFSSSASIRTIPKFSNSDQFQISLNRFPPPQLFDSTPSRVLSHRLIEGVFDTYEYPFYVSSQHPGSFLGYSTDEGNNFKPSLNIGKIFKILSLKPL
jgi:hypothetical protein